MHLILRQLWPAVGLTTALTIVTGVIYPAAITLVAQAAFPSQANGSLVTAGDGRVVGSSLIGQSFTDPGHLWGRLSYAGDGYDANASAGSNLGPTSATLIERVTTDMERLQAEHGAGPVPADLVTASASGLDPHVSPAGAAYQVDRIASARGIDPDAVRAVIARHTELPLFGFLGQARVNVLEVNLELDGLSDG